MDNVQTNIFHPKYQTEIWRGPKVGYFRKFSANFVVGLLMFMSHIESDAVSSQPTILL